jgi:hypothetical protein
MKSIAFLLAILIVLTSIGADAATKKKSKTKLKKTTQTSQKYVIAIGYPNADAALSGIKARSDIAIKANARPFGWQQRSGPWFVANENPNFEWAFTQPGHYAHPSVVKRMIDIGSKDHVYVDMALRCGAANRADCDTLLTEFKDVNLLIRKVYQKKYIKTADGEPAWAGVDSLD